MHNRRATICYVCYASEHLQQIPADFLISKSYVFENLIPSLCKTDVLSQQVLCISCLRYLNILNKFIENYLQITLTFGTGYKEEVLCRSTYREMTISVNSADIWVTNEPKQHNGIVKGDYQQSRKILQATQISSSRPMIDGLSAGCSKSFLANQFSSRHKYFSNSPKMYRSCKSMGNSSCKQSCMPREDKILFNCSICTKLFATSNSLEDHILAIHPAEKLRPVTIDNNDLVRRDHNAESCVTPPSKDKPYLCTLCNKPFKYHNHLKSHLRTHPGIRLYSCTLCNQQFTDISTLKSHQIVHFEVKKRANVLERSTHLKCQLKTDLLEKPYSCKICSKSFTKNCYLIDHARTHTGEKPYFCKICSKSFARKSNLTFHFKTHSGEKPYFCTICNKLFRTGRNLRRHHMTHTGEKPYSCTMCDKAFADCTSLKIHFRIHSGERPHACLVCNKTFIKPCQLTLHIRTHSNEKPFLCVQCGKSYTQSSALKLHLRSHFGETPFSCTICNKSFKRKENLQYHRAVHFEDRQHRCVICAKLFKRSIDLKVHLKSHSEEKTYCCTKCNKSFTFRSNLNAHLKLHEKNNRMLTS